MDEERLSRKARTLISMAEQEFGQSRKWTMAERKVLAVATTNDFALCGPTYDDQNEANNPEHAGQWPSDRSIDGKVIRWLCADRRVRELLDPSGIRIYGARIINGLDLANLVVPFSLLLRSCAVEGDASLYGLEIHELDLQRTWVGLLDARSARVAVGIFLSGTHVNGSVLLDNAQIGGGLYCTSGRFTYAHNDISPNGTVLTASSMSVKGIYMDGSRFEGEVRLTDAQIGGTVSCRSGRFSNLEKEGSEGSGRALTLARSVIAGDVLLDEGFRAEGSVDFTRCHIGGDLYCGKGDFTDADMFLYETSVSTIFDEDASWPKGGHLYVDGFVYRMAYPLDADTRLQWLALQPEDSFFSQPYLQLAKVLADMGDEDGRVKVLVAMKDREWAVERRGSAAFPGLLQKYAIGYGYRPLLAFWEVMGLSVLGWIIYRRSYLAGAIVPTDKDACEDFRSSGQPPSHHRRFFPLIYSIENSLPLVKLGQEEKWQPDPCPSKSRNEAAKPTLGVLRSRPDSLQRFLVFVGLQAADNPAANPSRASRWGTSSRFVHWFLWAQILLGWLLATLFLAGVSGIIKKE